MKTTVIKQTYSNGKIYIWCDYGKKQNPNELAEVKNPLLAKDSEKKKLTATREIIATLEGKNATKENTIAKKFEFIQKLNSTDPKVGYNVSGGGKKKEAEKEAKPVVKKKPVHKKKAEATIEVV